MERRREETSVAMATAALLNSLSLFLNLAHILSLVCFLFSYSLSLARLAHSSFLPQQQLSKIIIQRKKGFKKSIDIDEGLPPPSPAQPFQQHPAHKKTHPQIAIRSYFDIMVGDLQYFVQYSSNAPPTQSLHKQSFPTPTP